MGQTSTYKLQVACFRARQTASILDPHSLLRSHVCGPSHQLHACCSTQGGYQGLNMDVLVLPPLKPKNLTRNQCQQTGQTRMQRHHHLQVKTLGCFDGETLLLWHRGVSAYLLTQTLAYKDDWLHGRVINTAPSKARSRHNSDKYSCEDVLLCAVPLAVLLTETEAQSGFTTWFL